jgi:OmpA-OmpF porin, OOP family
MSKKTLYILGIIVVIILGTWLYRLYCCHKPGETGNRISNPFVLQGNGINFKCEDGFKFPLNSFNPIFPIGDSITIGLNILKEKLNSDTSLKLLLTGYCLSSETNRSTLPDLGQARAHALKEYLVSQGIPSDRIEISGETNDNLLKNNQFVFGAANFRIGALPVQKPDLLVLYFNSGQSKTDLAAGQNQLLENFVNYLVKVPVAGIKITGYTDNIGNKMGNISLGQKRAEYIKNYFLQKGIPETGIECLSLGPDDPAAENSLAEGRAKNRRAVIQIK